MKLAVSFWRTLVCALLVGVVTDALAQTPQGDSSNEASLPVVAADVQRSNVSLPVLAVQNHLDSWAARATPSTLTLGGEVTTGLAAGDAPQRFGFWASANRTRLENTREASAYDGHALSLMVGGEYYVDESVVVGLGLGYDRTDIDTVFNNGSVKADGVAVTPYVGYTINSWLRTSLMAGYSYSEADQSRSGGAITGSQTTTRWFGLASLSANTWVDRFNLTGTIGYLGARDRNHAFTESNGTRTEERHNTLGQMQVGGQVGYWMNGFMPYLSATYLNDVYRTSQASGQSSGRNAVRLGAGLNLFDDGGAFGGIGVTHEAGRRHAQSTSLAANIGIRF